MTEWKKLPQGNEIISKDDFYISYNSDANSNEIAQLCAVLASATLGNEAYLERNEETALVQGRNFFILIGDFREQYASLAEKGFEACYQFYLDNIEKSSVWSNKIKEPLQ